MLLHLGDGLHAADRGHDVDGECVVDRRHVIGAELDVDNRADDAHDSSYVHVHVLYHCVHLALQCRGTADDLSDLGGNH